MRAGGDAMCTGTTSFDDFVHAICMLRGRSKRWRCRRRLSHAVGSCWSVGLSVKHVVGVYAFERAEGMFGWQCWEIEGFGAEVRAMTERGMLGCRIRIPLMMSTCCRVVNNAAHWWECPADQIGRGRVGRKSAGFLQYRNVWLMPRRELKTERLFCCYVDVIYVVLYWHVLQKTRDYLQIFSKTQLNGHRYVVFYNSTDVLWNET